MTKKDYELIARVIKTGICCQSTLTEFAEVLSDNFKIYNKKFDKTKFLKACGIE